MTFHGVCFILLFYLFIYLFGGGGGGAGTCIFLYQVETNLLYFYENKPISYRSLKKYCISFKGIFLLDKHPNKCKLSLNVF